MQQAPILHTPSVQSGKTIKVNFIEKNSDQPIQVDALVGMTLLEVTRTHGIDLEGACDGALACSTCHVIVASEWYDRLAAPSADEDDMLDLAFGLTPTSRLGCQIILTPDMDGLTVTIPDQNRHLVTGMKG